MATELPKAPNEGSEAQSPVESAGLFSSAICFQLGRDSANTYTSPMSATTAVLSEIATEKPNPSPTTASEAFSEASRVPIVSVVPHVAGDGLAGETRRLNRFSCGSGTKNTTKMAAATRTTPKPWAHGLRRRRRALPSAKTSSKLKSSGERSAASAAAFRLATTGSSRSGISTRSGISISSRNRECRVHPEVGSKDRPASIQPRPDGASRHPELADDLIDAESHDRVKDHGLPLSP